MVTDEVLDRQMLAEYRKDDWFDYDSRVFQGLQSMMGNEQEEASLRDLCQEGYWQCLRDDAGE